MKTLFALVILALPVLGFGITPESQEKSILTTDEDEPRIPGYIDAQGRKQGYFVIYGKDVPEKTEYPPDGRVEEGNYKDDRKHGEWITYHPDGVTPRVKGMFVDGRANGAYEKYDQDGNKIEESSYHNGKQLGNYTSYYANGQPKQQKTFNAEGKEHGVTTFYFENGKPQFVVNKVNGVPTGEATRYWEDGSVKEVLVYDDSGKVISTTVVNADPPATASVETGSGGPNGSGGILKEGKKFQPDGYNKVYNQAQELWMDGQFKGGKLWEGKLYKYDSDGILLNIEIWKNGAYHSDGQL